MNPSPRSTIKYLEKKFTNLETVILKKSVDVAEHFTAESKDPGTIQSALHQNRNVLQLANLIASFHKKLQTLFLLNSVRKNS